MCGIAGVYFKKKKDEKKLKRFKELVETKQQERGPDHFGSLKIKDNFYFFHNRLSIIDIEHAFQPMSDGVGTLVYNGEIYNFKDLKQDNLDYKYDSDTEVLLKGLNEKYINFLEETNSMFGFGYYNHHKDILTIARDRVGIKQVYYIDNDDVFAFASTLTPLVLFSRKELNTDALWQFYQNRAFKAPNTIFKDIKLLNAGTYLEFNLRSKNITKNTKWWERAQLSNDLKDPNTIIGELDVLLHDAVKNRLVSDVPVGAYLSGGVDSSLVTAIASKYYDNMETFTVAMKDKRYDESKYAKKLSSKYGLKYNEIVVDGDDFLSGIDEWIELQDDIVSDPSVLVHYNLAKLARNSGFKVMLAGEGADELFGGYISYSRYLKSVELNKYLRYLQPAEQILSNIFKSDSRKKHFILNTIRSPKFYGTALIFEPHLLNDMLRESFEDSSIMGLKEAMDLDIKDRLPNDLLISADRASMGSSIEARVPFLAHQLIDYSSKIDKSLFVKNGETKYLIKKLAEKYIPYENIYRKKVGFDLPIEHWFRNELKDKLSELIETSVQRDIINIKIIQQIFNDHLKGKTNASGKLWAFMSLELSYRYLSSIR